MRTAFNQTRMENSLNRDGYVIVDFLQPAELEEIRNSTRELGFGIANKKKLRISIIHGTSESRNEIFEKLSPVFQRVVERFMQNYKVIRIGYFDKLPGGDGLRVHQHANLVDESKYRSLTVWIPLTDTNIKMGTLHVAKSSHLFTDYIRSYDDYFTVFEKVSARVMKRHSIPLSLTAGQAVIFDDRLIHWSPPNKSSRIRTAIQLELVPQEAELAIYYRANDQELLKYAIGEKTYRVSALTFEKPDDLQFIGKLNQPNVSYGNRQFISMIRGANSDNTRQERNFFRRLFNM
jgi:hypothetical protein